MFCQGKLSLKIFWLLPIASGLLLGLVYPPSQVVFLLWLAFLPLFIFLYSKIASLKKSFGAGFLTGLIFFGLILRWLFNTLPLDWLGLKNQTIGFVFIFLIWLISSGFLALFIGLFSLFFYLNRKNNWLNIILAPSFWIIFEYLRAWLFGILWLGPSSLIGPHWTLGNLAYALAPNENIRQLAGLGGIYFLSFIIVFINALIFFFFLKLKDYFTGQKKILLPLFYFSLIIFLIIGFNCIGLFLKQQKISQQKSSQPIEVALIQTKVPSFFFETALERIKTFGLQAKLLERANQGQTNPQIIIFPEDSRFLSALDSAGQQIIENNFKQKNILVVDSGRKETPNQSQTQLVYYQTQKGIIGQSGKFLLTPIGEYLPYWLSVIAKLTGQTQWLEDFQKARTYQKDNKIEIIDFEGIKISGLICSDILSPKLYQKLTQNGAELLLNSASEAPFHNSKTLSAQILAISQLRATENNRYLIRAVNAGYSYVLNNWGNIENIAADTENQVINSHVLPLKQKMWYNKFSNWILYLALIVILTKELIWYSKKKLRNTKNLRIYEKIS